VTRTDPRGDEVTHAAPRGVTATHAETRRTGPRRPLQIVSPDEVRRIHETSLDILSEVGCVYYSKRALDVLAEAGAEVDYETTVAKLPPALVERALATLPHSFTLGGRTPAFDLPIDGEHAYITSDGCATFVREHDGSVRPSTKADVSAAARVVQGLDNISATSALVSAQDCPVETRVLHEFDACMRASEKHAIVVSVKDETEARDLIRMAQAVAGGARELRERPTFSVILCTVSPLHQERFGMDLAFTLAEAGIPMMLYPMPILGATAPVTPAGAAVVNNAEILGAVTAIQLAHPGARLIHAGGPTALYMRTGAYFANVPEALLLRALQGQMARFYGLPAGLGWGGTKGKQPGAQAAYENTLGMMLELFAGADFLFGAGLLDSVTQMSLEELVVADEVFGMVGRLLRGVKVDREHLAGELIERMGFKGNYLFDNHTRAHVRELWQARLGETGTYEGWLAAGAPSTADRAQARVDELLAADPPAFPDDLAREFDAIIAAAEA
jgi:trimethylamine---corrinoid protein Co-methyltransferase